MRAALQRIKVSVLITDEEAAKGLLAARLATAQGGEPGVNVAGGVVEIRVDRLAGSR